MRYIFLFLTTLFLNGCTNNLKEQKQRISGYWIPQNIHWQKPSSGIPDIDSLARFSSFVFLYFNEKDECYSISSTQGFPIGYDSLIFEYEPGVEIAYGKIDWLNDISFTVQTQVLISPFKEAINTTKRNHCNFISKDKINWNDIVYVKTNSFDSLSTRKIHAYIGR